MKFKTIMGSNYVITYSSIRARNLQTNTIFERAHQTISNIIFNFWINNIDLEDENLWEGIFISTIMFAIL